METVVWGEGDQPTRHNRDVSVTKVGRYRVLRKIDTGGAGEVYLGAYDIMGREVRVAIKLLKSSHAHDDASNLRFREEVRMLMELAHPNICRVLDGGDEGGRLYMVMEFADGGSLKDRVKDLPDGCAEPSQALRWLEEAARGLLAAETHVDERGKRAPVYHRDIKPANLLLQDGRVVVADFGAAKTGGDAPGLTTTVTPASWTPEYGSPEQWRGRLVDQRSDIYSLGVTFYKLLTGELPQKRFTHADQRFDEPHDPRLVRPAVPKDLAVIIRKMTEPDVENRYQGFAELLADLDRLSPDGSKQVRPSLWLRLLPVFLVAGAAVAGVLIWRGEGSDVRPDPILVLEEERRRQLLEGVQTAAGQLQAAVADQDPLQPQLVSGVPPELRLPAAALVERLADARALLDEARSEQPKRDLPERLVAMRGRLVAARETYDTARVLLGDFEQASSELATRKRPALDQLVMRAVPADNPELEQRRRQLVDAIATLRDTRRNEVGELRARLGRGESDLDGLRRQVAELRDELRSVEETQLVDSLDRLFRDIEVAIRLQAGLAPWSPTDSLKLPDVERLKQLAEALRGTEPPPDASKWLQDWWRQRRREQEQVWRLDLQRAVVELRERLAQQLAALGADAAPAAELELAVQDYTAIRAAVLDAKLIDGAVPEALRLPEPKSPPTSTVTESPPPKAPLPEGWPDKRFEPPPGLKSLLLRPADVEARRLYSGAFLERAEKAGVRLWYSPSRLDRNQRYVYQAFVVDERLPIAALIDIHPLTLGELRMYDRFRTPAYLYGAIKDLPDSAFYPSCSDRMSEAFARIINDRPNAAFAADGYGQFDVAPAGWRQWSGCVRFSAPPALLPTAAATPGLVMPLAGDLATVGVAYLASGVKEWGRLREGAMQPQGESEIAEDPSDPRKGIGARLALILRRR